METILSTLISLPFLDKRVTDVQRSVMTFYVNRLSSGRFRSRPLARCVLQSCLPALAHFLSIRIILKKRLSFRGRPLISQWHCSYRTSLAPKPRVAFVCISPSTESRTHKRRTPNFESLKCPNIRLYLPGS